MPSTSAQSAQQASGTEGSRALLERTERELARLAALKAIETDRSGFVAEISNRFRSAAQDELQSWLAMARPEQLVRASTADSLEELNAIMLTAPSSAIGPRAFGDSDSDLVFFPLTPCRIIDTRFTGAGKLSPSVPRAFSVNGDMTSQGGDAAGCGLPGTDVAAVVATVTVTSINGAGDVRAWQQGAEAAPNASVVNYNANGESGDVANTTVIPCLQSVVDANEIQFMADVQGTQLVVDVVGYFWSPTAAPLDQTFQTSAAVIITQGASGTATSPACPAGHSVTGGSCIITDVGTHLSTSRRSGNAWVCIARNTGATAPLASLSAEVICSRTPGR